MATRAAPTIHPLALNAVEDGLREADAVAVSELSLALGAAFHALDVPYDQRAEIRDEVQDNMSARLRAVRGASASASSSSSAPTTDPVGGLADLVERTKAAIEVWRGLAPRSPRWPRLAFLRPLRVRRFRARVQDELKKMHIASRRLRDDLRLPAQEEVRAAVARNERRRQREGEAEGRPDRRHARLAEIVGVKLTSYRETLLPELVVSTAAAQDLERRIQRVGGSSIGLAGPRGVGKSTLLRVASQVDRRGGEPDGEGPPRHLGVVVAAPVAYEPLAFLTALAGSLARAVESSPVHRSGGSDEVWWEDTPPRDAYAPRRERAGVVGVTTVVVAAALLVAGGLGTVAPQVAAVPSTAGLLRAGVAGVAGLVVLGGLILIPPRHRPGDALPAAGTVAVPTLARGAFLWAAQATVVYAAAKLANGALQRWELLGGDGWAASVSRTWHEDGLGDARVPLLLVVGGLSLAVGVARSRGRVPSWWWIVNLALWPIAGMILRRRRRRSMWPEVDDVLVTPMDWEPTMRRCQALHRRLTALVTDEHGTEHGGGIGLGALSLSFGGHRSRAAAEQPLTLPEAVTALRDVYAEVAAVYGRLVIGVDELDKLASQDEATTFLNNLKALFGIPRVTFLVTVSDSAVASFERRGIPFRDAFDSAFDEIVRVPALGLDSCRDLLVRRTAGALPSEAMIWIAFILSGGLPRDLVRTARTIVDVVHVHGTAAPLPLVVRRVARAEVQEKASGFAERTADRTQESDAVATWGIHDLARDGSDGLDAAVWRQVRDIEDLEEERRSFVAYAALVLTLSDLLVTASRDDGVFRLAALEDRTEAGEGPLVDLARARSRLAVSPLSTLALVLDVRRREGLPDLVPAQVRARTP